MGKILPVFSILVVIVCFGILFYFFWNEKRKIERHETIVQNIIEHVRSALREATNAQLELKSNVNWKTLRLHAPKMACEFLWPTSLTLSTNDERGGFARQINGALTERDGAVLSFTISQGGEGDARSRHKHGIHFVIESVPDGTHDNKHMGEGCIHTDANSTNNLGEGLDQIFCEAELHATHWKSNAPETKEI